MTGTKEINLFFKKLKDNLAVEHKHSWELIPELSTPHPTAEPPNPTCKVNLLLGFICWRGNSPSMEAGREKGHKSAKLLLPKLPQGRSRAEGSVLPREPHAAPPVSDQLCRACTAWEEMSSSSSSLPLPALPFSPLPVLLGRPLPIKQVL